jgi:hypothetical protein
MTDPMTDPTTPRPTDAAIALVREALHSGVLMHAAAPDDVIKTRTPGFSVDGALMRDRLVEGLFAHPTLARVIAIGQAWLAAEGDRVLSDLISKRPCPHGHLDVMHVAPFHFEGPACPLCSDAEYADRMQREEPCGVCALAAALTDQERGS